MIKLSFRLLLISMIFLSCTGMDYNLNIEVSKNHEFTYRVLTKKGIGDIIIGKTFQEIKNIYSNYKFEYFEEFYGYSFSDSNNTFKLFLTVIDDTLTGITISDKNFKLENGLMIGSSISEIKKNYPKTPINYNQHDEEEMFEITNEQSFFDIRVESNDNKILGKYKKDVYDSTIDYRLNGKITSISVFLNKPS